MSLKIFIFCLILIAFVANGCKTQTSTISPTTTVNSSKTNESSSRKIPVETTNPTTDPTCCDYLHEEAKGVERAWEEFTKDGKYRLATRADMNFPESVKQKFGVDCNNIYRSFAYPWGDRGFGTLKRHLAAIVVDTKRKNASKFSLVIFSVKGKSEDYKPYWLYQNKDLSRTSIDCPSGYLFIRDYNDDGTANSCDVFWKEKQKKYVCVSEVKVSEPPKICLY